VRVIPFSSFCFDELYKNIGKRSITPVNIIEMEIYQQLSRAL
jgi:hypothetical protein